MSKRKLPRGGGTQVALSPELAIAAIGLFSEFADGESSGSTGDMEDAALGEMLSAIDLYEDYSEEDFAALGTEIGTLIREEGIEAVAAQAIITAREEGLEEAAYIIALVVIASDGEVPESEQEYIDSLYQALGISEERANEIIDELFSDDEEEEEDEDEE